MKQEQAKNYLLVQYTTVDLEAKIKSNEFRKDLYHRLKILPLELPSLAERIEDIPLLANAFLKAFN
ncbi:MAG: sigma 54-interacting transcriptional regulator [Bacteroidota bacterium]